MRKDVPDYYIPCGKCDGCTISRSQAWAIRIFHESQMHERNCFLTLTYKDAPEKINRADPQKFIKRLRRSNQKIRYFLTGEYGEQTRRPHYHAIVFGEDYLGGAYDIDTNLYGNVFIDERWGHGSVSIGALTVASAMYVAGYCNKKIGDSDTFAIMSRNPPIGTTWVRQHADNLRRNEQVVINGQSMPIPKTYLNWLEGVEDYGHIKLNRAEKAKKPLDDRQARAKGLSINHQKLLREHKI